MKDMRLITIITIIILLSLTACSDLLNILVLQKKGKNYFVGKISYSDWTGRGGTITLLDKKKYNKVVSGKYSMTMNSLACYGKKFHAKLACSDGRTADLDFTITTSCTESFGYAVDNSGNEYEVYIGISDEVMKKKLAAYEMKI